MSEEPKRRKPGAGRKSKSGQPGGTKGMYFRFAPDVQQILSEQSDRTACIENSVRRRNTYKKITQELYRILKARKAPSELLGYLGSFDDTRDDNEILDFLIHYHR